MNLPLLFVARKSTYIHAISKLKTIDSSSITLIESVFELRKQNIDHYSLIIADVDVVSYFDIETLSTHPAKFLLLANNLDAEQIQEYFKLGISAIFNKSKNCLGFDVCFKQWFENDAYLSPEYIFSITQSYSNNNFQKLNQLSNRRASIARLIAEGKTYKEIAEKNYISVETVRDHVKNIYKQLGIHSSKELRQVLTY